MVRDFSKESLSHDPVHGYIPFISKSGLPAGEVAEQAIIDHPWVQRMRQIHQLQTAWWVFPSAEHMRFQHVLGVMHLAAVACDHWYESLRDACANVPSRAYVECAAADGRSVARRGARAVWAFFRRPLPRPFGITHEDIGSHVISTSWGTCCERSAAIRGSQLNPLEELEPKQIAWLIRRPAGRWTGRRTARLAAEVASLFSGIYTVDNMDFVLRDAYMSGYNTRAFDLWRLLHYTFFTEAGLTIHSRGLPTLMTFIDTRANLFRTIYFHRTVRAIDLALEEVFPQTRSGCFRAIRSSISLRIAISPSRRSWSTWDGGRRVRSRSCGIGRRNGRPSSRGMSLGRWPASGRSTFTPALPSGRRFFPNRTSWNTACGDFCRRSLARFPSASMWPATITAPAAGGRREARTFCSTRPTARCRSSTTTNCSGLCRELCDFRVYSKDHRHDVPILQGAQFALGRRGRYENEYVTGKDEG